MKPRPSGSNFFKRNSCIQKVAFIAPLFFLTSMVFAQSSITWDKVIGGESTDILTDVRQTADGGYILGGYSNSDKGGDKSQAAVQSGQTDFWIVKLAADGTKEWDRTYGTDGDDQLVSIRQTTDGGYIVGGNNAGRGNGDFWILRLAANGALKWEKTIGGPDSETLNSVQQTADGGFLLGGISSSGKGDDKTHESKGDADYWIVKLLPNGNKAWDLTIGGSGYDELHTARETEDGGYILAGYSDSPRGQDKGSNPKGSYDYWIIKLKADRTKAWDKTLGGRGVEVLSSIEQTIDGGYILGGFSFSGKTGDKTEVTNGSADYWIVKLSGNGTKEWDKTLGGDDYDSIRWVEQASDGGFIVGGDSPSSRSGDKSENFRGDEGEGDFWIVKLAADGTKLWDKTIGAGSTEFMASIQSTADGGYVLGGYSNSLAGFDKTENPVGDGDYWVVKLSPEIALPVTLTQFSARKEAATCLLSWTTTAETRSKQFEVEHSLDGKSWNALGIINAKGESKNVMQYQYVHQNPVMDAENLYRLKMVDVDGTFAYSRIESLAFEGDGTVSVYPNPASDMVTLQIGDWKNVRKVELLNSLSNSVYTSAKPVKSIDVKHLQPGIYFAKVTSRDGSARLHKVMVAH